MKLLEERILKDGIVRAGNVLKVDSFLNHQIDVPFVAKLGEEFHRLYENEGVTKILTIEASGIGVACLAAQYFGVPVVFAKKSETNNISRDVYSAEVYSFTHEKTYNVRVSKDYISADDRVLIIDDFLAKGNALIALVSIAKAAGASVVGAGIVIEKAYQSGGELVRGMGVRVESLAKIASMDDGKITFAE